MTLCVTKLGGFLDARVAGVDFSAPLGHETIATIGRRDLLIRDQQAVQHYAVGDFIAVPERE